ncbi:sulfate permease-like protein [Venturia nashicola]|nr:sulfate permease-like protein [Venturia nashicola]
MPNLKSLLPHRLRRSSAPADTPTFLGQGDGISHYVEHDPTVGEWFRDATPNGHQVIAYLSSLFPFSRWIFSYNLRWLLGDLIAGITVGLVVIPQGMAYAKLAGLPVQFGLYTSFMGALSYWIFGTSKDINIGPVAVVSMVTGAVLTEAQEALPKEYERYVVASALALLSGCLVTLVGLLRLGWLVDFIALPAVSGFITGSGITISLGQVPTLLGMKGVASGDAAYLMFIHIFTHMRTVRLDALTGISALVGLYAIKFTCEWACKKWPARSKLFFFMSCLRTVFILLLFTLISFLVNRQHRQKPKFSLIGFVPSGFRDASLPKMDMPLIQALAPSLPAVFIHISIAKSFGRINNYTIDPSQEILAIGVTNVLGPFIGAFPATGSFSRTAIKSKAGVKTPFAGVIAAGLVLLAIYALAPVFFYVPNSSLAAIIVHAVGDLITPPSTLIMYWKISPTDFIIFVIGLVVILFSSIEHGVFAMIGLSAAILLFRMFKARGRFMGTVAIQLKVPAGEDKKKNNDEMIASRSVTPIGSTTKSMKMLASESPRTIFLPLGHEDGSNPSIKIDQPGSGIFIYRFSQDFNYTNANSYIDHFLSHITTHTRVTTPSTATSNADRPWNDPHLSGFGSKNSSDQDKDEADTRPTLKAVILDFAAVNLVDMTSVQLLVDARKALDRHASPDIVQWHFANIQSRWTKRALGAAGFGVPSTGDKEGDGGMGKWRAVYGVAEFASNKSVVGAIQIKAQRMSKDVELGHGQATVITSEDIDVAGVDSSVGNSSSFDKDKGEVVTAKGVEVEKAPVTGVNRPFFHVNLEIALRCARENIGK